MLLLTDSIGQEFKLLFEHHWSQKGLVEQVLESGYDICLKQDNMKSHVSATVGIEGSDCLRDLGVRRCSRDS